MRSIDNILAYAMIGVDYLQLQLEINFILS
jgi:hypothetical protein